MVTDAAVLTDSYRRPSHSISPPEGDGFELRASPTVSQCTGEIMRETDCEVVVAESSVPRGATPIRGRVVMPRRDDVMIALFIKRPLSGEPQDEYCCRRSLQSRTI